MTAARRLGAAAFGAVAILAACTEDPLSLGTDEVPGASTQTTDVTISVAELERWRDTTLTGFALRSNAPFATVSNGSSVTSRALSRFNVPDTIRTPVDTLPVARFEEVEMMMRIDTVRSAFGELPVTVRVIGLEQPFDVDSVSWIDAAPGVPWAAAGGALGVEIASAVMETVSDTLILPVSVDQDSLMKAWQDTDGGNGFAIVVDGPETRLHVTRTLLQYDPTLVGRQLPVPQVQQWTEYTFIVDPPEGREPAREMVMVMNAFDTNLDGDNEVYAVNTSAFFHHHHPVRVGVGDLCRVYLVNATEFDLINSFHLHAGMFKVFRTGTQLDRYDVTDTIMLCQGERHVLEFRLENPGKHMFHAHQSEFADLGWMGFFEAVEHLAAGEGVPVRAHV